MVWGSKRYSISAKISGSCGATGKPPTTFQSEHLQGSMFFLVPCVWWSICFICQTHRIHVWYIYLHLVDFYGKCRYIYHTWILWETVATVQTQEAAFTWMFSEKVKTLAGVSRKHGRVETQKKETGRTG